MAFSNRYTLLFAFAVCIVCSIFVAGSAVGLRERQRINRVVDRQAKVLGVVGLLTPGERWPAEKIIATFEEHIDTKIIELATGLDAPQIDAEDFDQQVASRRPESSRVAPANPAQITRLPHHAALYRQMEGDQVKRVVIPIEGKGLWSTLYGYLALSPDFARIEGITFYEHGETPGLGGEIENPRWQAVWQGRIPFDGAGHPVVRVIKGSAGSPDDNPHEVDGLSGATITGRGVTHLVQFWLGHDGFGPYIERTRHKVPETEPMPHHQDYGDGR